MITFAAIYNHYAIWWLHSFVILIFTCGKGQSWGFTSHSRARVMLGRPSVLSLVGVKATHRGTCL